MMPAATATAPANAAIVSVDALLQPFNRSDAPGFVIGINQHGRSLYRRGFGLASIEQGVANTPRTRMRIASTSKHFTALALMLLAEEGKLDIDDRVERHLPELPQLSPAGPTLRQLMQHTGGQRGHDEMWLLAQGFGQQPAGFGMAAMARQSELNFEPGTQMIYSNGGYHLLARVVERVGGLGFGEFLKTRIFDPLGLHDTESVASDLEVRPGLASLYIPALRAPGAPVAWQRGLHPGALDGSGSLISTVDDMLVWLAHLRSTEKTVGSAASWAQMLAPTTLASGVELPYGFGLLRHPYRGVEVIHHNGGVLGGASQMITVPAHALDIMIMSNGAAVAPTQLAFKAIDLLLADALSEPAGARARASAYPGLIGQRYHAPETGALLRFAAVGDQLGLAWRSNGTVPLRTREHGLALEFVDLGASPIEIDLAGVAPGEAPQTLALREGGQLQHLRRLPQVLPNLLALAPSLCGDYRCADLDASARIDVDGETLLLAIQGRHGRQVGRLQAVSDDVLTFTSIDPLLAALGGALIVNIERAGERVTGLRLDTARTRHLGFIRENHPA